MWSGLTAVFDKIFKFAFLKVAASCAAIFAFVIFCTSTIAVAHDLISTSQRVAADVFEIEKHFVEALKQKSPIAISAFASNIQGYSRALVAIDEERANSDSCWMAAVVLGQVAGMTSIQLDAKSNDKARDLMLPNEIARAILGPRSTLYAELKIKCCELVKLPSETRLVEAIDGVFR